MSLPESERATKMNSSLFRDDKGLEKDLNNMMYGIEGWIGREHDELQICYAKRAGRKVFVETYDTQ